MFIVLKKEYIMGRDINNHITNIIKMLAKEDFSIKRICYFLILELQANKN